MRSTSVFVSSTCYDLRSLREHLRCTIESLGHDPVLSEYPSFPVSPELTTVENCKRAVRERADLFLLVVGGKRGSLDSATERSVVNSEYREAKRAGLDCFVFVDRQVWDLLPHYKKNPNADFSPTVDNSGVFVFLEELIRDTRWIFQFQRTEEIISVLKTQLSVRLQDLLQRARENRLTVPADFVGEPNHILDVVINKNKLWEYRLACELLKDRMAKIDAKFADLNKGFVFRRTRFLAVGDTINHIQNLLSDLQSIVLTAAKVLQEDIVPGFGPLGVPGDGSKIKRGCDNLYALFLEVYEWELDLRFVRPHELFVDLFNTMHGWSSQLLSEYHRLPRELETLISQPGISGQHTIELIIKEPDGIADFIAAFDELAKNLQTITALVQDA